MKQQTLLDKLDEFEKTIKRNGKTNEFLYTGSTAMNLILLSDKIETFSPKAVFNQVANIQGDLTEYTRRMHDIDIHTFSQELYEQVVLRGEEGRETVKPCHMIEYDETWFHTPKEFKNGPEGRYIVIDSFNEKDNKSVNQLEYSIVTVGGKKYRTESPLNLLAYKSVFSLGQLDKGKDKIQCNIRDIKTLSMLVQVLQYDKQTVKDRIASVMYKFKEKLFKEPDMTASDYLEAYKREYEEMFETEPNDFLTELLFELSVRDIPEGQSKGPMTNLADYLANYKRGTQDIDEDAMQF